MSREEWEAVGSLVDDRIVVIKNADKGSCVVLWDRNDYLQEAERQLSDTKVYRDVSNRDVDNSSVTYRKQIIECSIVLKEEVFLTEKQRK